MLEALRLQDETTSRFRTLIGAFPAAVLVEDQNRRILIANEAFTTLFSIAVPPEDLLGADCSDAAEQSKHLFADPEDFVASVKAALAAQVPRVDEPLHMSDGRVLRRHYIPVHQLGKYLGHMWLYRDVTERWTTTRQLARSQAELAEAQRVARVGSWTWDPMRDHVEWSDELRRIFGLSAADSPPSFAEHPRFYSPESMAQLKSLVLRCLETAEPFELECDIITVDGEQRHAVARGEPVLDAAGKLIGMRGTLADVNERHMVELALRASESRARALVHQLQQEDAAKDRFIGTLSHELRNPLAAVSLALDELREFVMTDATANSALEVAERHARRLTRLVDDLLDVTRMTKNTIALRTEPLLLNELALQIAHDNSGFFSEFGVALHVRTESSPILLTADSDRLHQAIGNLLHNAAKFSESGGSVTLELERDTVAQQAVIRVKDQGRGIAAHDLPKVFQPFTQVSRKADFPDTGLGLGLAIVKQIVQLHGGTISVDSEGLGKGAQFTLRLPLSGAPQPEEQRRPDADAATSIEQSKRALGLRILLIEDEPDLQQLTAVRLKKRGHVVTAVGSGAEGVAAALREKPDVILCDIGMPGMDGFEVAKAIRSSETEGRVRLIALTGYSQPADFEKAFAAGFDDYLVKPMKAADLDTVLARTPRLR